jgi:hypothetical protein
MTYHSDCTFMIDNEALYGPCRAALDTGRQMSDAHHYTRLTGGTIKRNSRITVTRDELRRSLKIPFKFVRNCIDIIFDCDSMRYPTYDAA